MTHNVVMFKWNYTLHKHQWASNVVLFWCNYI